MITVYGRILRETAIWLVFAPAVEVEPVRLGPVRLLDKRQVQRASCPRYGLDAVRMPGLGRRRGATPSRQIPLFAR